MNTSIEKDILAFGKERNPDEFPILALAYMGDAVMELFARDYVLNFSGEVRPAALVHASKAIITCEAQSDGVERILEHLTEKEMAVFKRGRNAHVKSVPGHASRAQYGEATALEALFGWLYLGGRQERINTLFHAMMEE